MMKKIKSVIFDFDGTLTKKGNIDFGEIRKAIKCPDHVAILEFIETLEKTEQVRAFNVVDDFEFSYAEKAEEEFYAGELIRYLNKKNIPVNIITRNSKRSLFRALQNFRFLNRNNFYKIITRDDPYPVKPDPTSIISIAKELELDTKEVCMVGDYIHDISAGQRAGSMTILKDNSMDIILEKECDFRVGSLEELQRLFYKIL